MAVLGGVDVMVGGTLVVVTVAAAVAFLLRLMRSERRVRRVARLSLVVASIWVAGVLAEVGSRGLLFGQPEAWNLLLGAIPICLAIALVSHSADMPGGNTRMRSY